jgi:flavin reductase (DIM6/NTAB) family NADH-FMN oxidoreductase RutF
VSRAISPAALDSLAFRAACGLFATGVAVLTTRAADGTPHGLTINSFSSLSLHPPLIIVAVDRDCTSRQQFEASTSFVVNILREEQIDLSIRFATLPEGRFTGVTWREGLSGSPVIEGVLGVIEAKTIQVIDAGDHRALIGEAVSVEIGEGRPLLFFGSEYARLA